MTNIPRLYCLVDVVVAERAGWAPRDLARAYLGGGATLLQLRAKTLESGAFFDLASAIVDDAASADARVVVNDRADLAVLSAAGGVHVGQDDLSPEDVRRIVGPAAIVGLSTHSEAQINDALDRPISYLAVGPVFWTATKATGYERVGLSLVASAGRLGAERHIPVVAIGGITLETARSAIEAGADAVAVITDLLTGNPETRVRQFLQALR